jgi:hypothetical protein
MLKEADTNREYIATPDAAQRSGLSRVYIAQLLRRGILEGFHFGRDWFVYTDSLEQFLKTKRRPGPKPGSKKPQRKTTTDTL